MLEQRGLLLLELLPELGAVELERGLHPELKPYAEYAIKVAEQYGLVFGTPAEVLPRLSSGAYDMVVCAGPPRMQRKITRLAFGGKCGAFGESGLL